MPPSYSKVQVEVALANNGFNILQQIGDFTIYQTNIQPNADDIIIDWSMGVCYWDDLKNHLESCGIDPKPIYDYLDSHS